MLVFSGIMKTYTATPRDIDHRWYLVDADGMVLGRLAAEVAKIIRGKHKPMFTPHMDTGDNVIVINASKLAISPRKAHDKLYHRHTGYPGGVRTRSLEQMLERDPEQVIRLAVRRMLPKGPLGRKQLKKLKIHAGPTHTHQAQQPVVRKLPDRAYARTNA